MAKIVLTTPDTIHDVKIYEVVVENGPGEENFSINDGLKNGLELAWKHIRKYLNNPDPDPRYTRYLGMLMLNEKLTVYFFNLY